MEREILIKKCVEGILARYAEEFEALILTGSFARGEETVRRGTDGEPVYVSDLEFLAVVKPEAWPLQIDAAAIEKDLGGVIEISIGRTTRRHLKEFKRTIFTLELRKFGRVLWGDEDVLRDIPHFYERDIAPLDGFILLNNRIAEQLKLRLNIEEGKPVESYHLEKGYIQIVNSLLAHAGLYHSLHVEKFAEFLSSGLTDDEHLIRTVKRIFVDFGLGNGELLAPEKSRKEWSILRESVKKAWLYEARAFLKSPQMDPEQVMKRFPSIVKLPERLKGWVKLVTRGKVSLLGTGKVLRNLFRTSPQFLIYREAVSLYFGDFDKEKAQAVVEKWERIVK